jgi:hypothetical protein
METIAGCGGGGDDGGAGGAGDEGGDGAVGVTVVGDPEPELPLQAASSSTASRTNDRVTLTDRSHLAHDYATTPGSRR